MNEVLMAFDSHEATLNVDPHGLQLWLVFIAVWVVFWGTVGGILGHKIKGRGLQGALLGATLAVIGIMFVLLQEDEPPKDPPSAPS